MKNHRMNLKTLLTRPGQTADQRLILFALLNLGVIESLAHGSISAARALTLFFNAENCLFVRKQLRNKAADQIMSHGVQLPDLFSALPADEAHREFRHELDSLRSLCLKLLEGRRLAA